MENELNEIFELCSIYQEQGLRVGQSLVNAVHALQPYLYADISGTLIDPYYCDDNVDTCLIHIMKELEKC